MRVPKVLVAIGSLVLLGCVTPPSNKAPIERPSTSATKPSVLFCEEVWRVYSVPMCFPDNLSGGKMTPITETIAMAFYDTPCGRCAIYFDGRQGVCGPEMMLGYQCEPDRYWVVKDGEPVVSTEEELQRMIVDYAPEEEGPKEST